MARQRDYAREYARRQERARAAGFRSYYERRVAGATTPAALAAKAGHRGYRDLLRNLRAGDVVSVDPGSVRDSRGRWKVVRINIITEDGTDMTYTMRNPSQVKIRAFIQKVTDVDAIPSPNYPPGILAP